MPQQHQASLPVLTDPEMSEELGCAAGASCGCSSTGLTTPRVTDVTRQCSIDTTRHDGAEKKNWAPLRSVGEVHFEITATCNLSCAYCYAEVERPGRSETLFPMSVYRRAIEVLADSSNRRSLEIIFHGGEPLLESAEWYDAACRLAVEILGSRGKSCEFGLQSNLTLLRDEHIDVFVRHRVKVGTSLDGPKEIHDAVRGRYEATVRNLRRLREAGVFSGAIAVLHHHNWDLVRDIYETFLSLDIRSFHLNVASAVGHGSGLLPLSEEQILRILRDDFDCMRHYDGEIVETRLLDKIRRYVSPPATREFLSQLKCDNPFCHAGINMVIFKANGEIYPCGCAGTSGNMRNFLLGNVRDDGLSTVLYSGQLRQFHVKTDKYERECRTCPARMVCEHGCPAFDMNDPVTPEHHCQATKRFEQYLAMQPRRDIERVAALVPKSSGER